MNKILKILVSKRFIILAVSGAALFLVISRFNVSLWYILIAGIILGVIFGKVFCRWVCPMGLIMELLMSMSPDGKFRQMYQYHKLGCPIAWISGWLNRYSIFKIELNADSCEKCGICDDKCYIVSMEPTKFSLYKSSKEKPGTSFSCSKCLECVAACPNGSLKYKMK
jgi:polyferredoxin